MSEKITQVAVSSKLNEWKWKSYISNADRSKKISKKTHGKWWKKRIFKKESLTLNAHALHVTTMQKLHIGNLNNKRYCKQEYAVILHKNTAKLLQPK